MASDRCIFTKEVGWSPDRVVMNENNIWNSIKRSEGVLLYKYTIAYVILSEGTKISTSYLQKKIVLSKIVPEEILKIKYCLVEKNKKERENYICLWKTSMISIRATEVNLVIKKNSHQQFEKDEALDHIWSLCFTKKNEDGKHKNEYFTLGLQTKNKGSFEHISLE